MSDAELRNELLGTWQKVRQHISGTAHKDVFTIFRSDNTWAGLQILDFTNNVKGRIDIEGTWRVANSRVIRKITSASMPQPISGAENRVLSISSSEFVMEGGSTRQFRYHRAPLPKSLPALVSPNLHFFRLKPNVRPAMQHPIAAPKPGYPLGKDRDLKTGKGLFGLLIDEPSGRVKVVYVLISTSDQILDDVARKALMRWEYRPGTVETVLVPVSFASGRGTMGAPNDSLDVGPQFWSD